MSRRNDSVELTRAYTYLGQRVAEKDTILAASACLDPKYRKLAAYILMYHEYFQCNDFNEELEAINILARMMWPRKEITDLSLRLGENIHYANFFEDEE